MIHTCPGCGQKNRVPEKYKGIPVCAKCKAQMFPTQMKAKRVRRWTWRDRYLAIPILMLAVPIYWAIDHDWSWLWDKVIDMVALVTVNVVIVSAIALSWLIIALALKVSWEEVWGSMQQRRRHPREAEEPLLDIGPWEVAQDYITLVRQKFTLRKERKINV